MGFIDNVKNFLKDTRFLGVGFLKHNLMRKAAGRIVTVPVRSIGNVYVRPGDSDIETLRQVFADQEYSVAWPSALQKRVDARYRAIVEAGKRPVIVDAGANIGAASIFFALSYPKAHIVAVEPDSGNSVVLRKNLLNRTNCTVQLAAIGSEAGFVKVGTSNAGSKGWAMQTVRSDDGVPVITIQDAAALVTDGQLFIVKIDIEGFESDLFSSNLDWLEDVDIVFIEPHDWMKPGERTSATFQRAMSKHPFELFIRGENLIYSRLAPNSKSV